MEGREESEPRILGLEIAVSASGSVSIGGDSRSSVPDVEADVSKANEMDLEKFSSRDRP